LKGLSVLDLRLNRSRLFDGLFAHLWRKCNQNPHNSDLTQLSENNKQNHCLFICHDLISQESKAAEWWETNSASIDDLAKIDLNDLKLCPSG
jgi:protein-arginine kinase activator protein McsA